ncbi:MAG: hypothetical protein EXQ70_11970 [Solirubrobacterales bacterium]|nr:hypothetical protein [Solirubrobacterales bacterium]
MNYDVRVDPGVSEDLNTLGDEQEGVPEDWRLGPEEVEAAIDRAIRLIASLREDPYQGDVLRGKGTQRILEGCRRLRFDPADPPPVDHRGAPRPRMRLVWVNEPDESAIALVRVLAVTHRYDSRPFRRAASRLGALRRRRR